MMVTSLTGVASAMAALLSPELAATSAMAVLLSSELAAKPGIWRQACSSDCAFSPLGPTYRLYFAPVLETCSTAAQPGGGRRGRPPGQSLAAARASAAD